MDAENPTVAPGAREQLRSMASARRSLFVMVAKPRSNAGAAQAIERQHRTNHHNGTFQGLTPITALTLSLSDRRERSDLASAFGALQT